jgi:5,10-methylenetetrahydromethanopterin reductase
VINDLISGVRASYDGQFLQWSVEAYLRFKPLRRVPIYVGAMSPMMLRAIGEYADGALPLLFPPEHYQNVMPYIREGAESAGRDLSKIDVAACIWASVSDDRAAAEDVLKEKIAYYGHALSPLILEQLGLTRDDFVEIEHAVQTENDIDKAKKMITEPMMRIGIAGNARDLIARLESLVAMGVNHISIGPPIGPDLRAAIETIGRDVIPHFR